MIILKENHRFYLTQAELDGLQDELSSLWLPQKTFRIKVFLFYWKNETAEKFWDIMFGQVNPELSFQVNVQFNVQVNALLSF